MAPIDARDTALIDTAASVVGALIVAHAHGDAEVVAGELARLLTAVAAFNKAHAERASDQPLRQAIERLNGFLA